MPERPHIPSPRQELIDQYWESHETAMRAEKEDSGPELLPNKATSRLQNVKAPALPAGKRMASTHSSDCTGSANPDSDDSDSDLSIQVVSKKGSKARKTLKELVKVEETDKDLDKEVVTKGKRSKKLSRKERGGDSDNEDSYKNST